MSDSIQESERLLKQNFENSGLKVLNNATDGIVGFAVKDKQGYSHLIYLRSVNMETSVSKVTIPKSDWNYELPENLWVALVLFMDDIEPHLYLIPSDVFHHPDSYIYFDNEQGERFKHLSNWEVKIFPEGIKKLSEYGFATSVKEFL